MGLHPLLAMLICKVCDFQLDFGKLGKVLPEAVLLIWVKVFGQINAVFLTV